MLRWLAETCVRHVNRSPVRKQIFILKHRLLSTPHHKLEKYSKLQVLGWPALRLPNRLRHDALVLGQLTWLRRLINAQKSPQSCFLRDVDGAKNGQVLWNED